MQGNTLKFPTAPEQSKLSDFDSRLFECSLDCVKLLDTDGHLLSMNQNGQCVMEIDDFSRVANLHWTALWPQKTHQAIQATLEAARQGKTGRFNAFCPTAKGTPKWWEVMVTPIHAPDGGIERLLSISRDVTAEHRANAELQDSQTRLALLLESSAEGIYGMAPDMTCTFINKAGAAILGYEPDELIGCQLHSMIHHHRADGTPYPNHECPITLALDKKTPARVGNEVFWRKDGTPVAVSYSVAPMMQDGVQAGAVVTFTDVSEHKKTEKALQDSEARFRSLANSIPQIVWIVDDLGRGVFFNKQWALYTGTPVESMMPADVAEQFVHPDDQAITAQAWQRALAEQSVYVVEHRIRSGSGQYRWFLVRGEPIFDPDTGKLVQWFGTSTDIHEHKEAEAQLRESAERVRLATDAAKLGIWVWDAATDTNTWENDRLYEMFGISRTEEPVNTARFIAEFIHPDDAVPFQQAVARALETKERFYYEGRFYRASDRALRWFEFTGLLHLDAEGKPSRMVGTAADITDRKLAERAVFNSRERLEKVISQAATGVVEADVSGRIVMANDKYCAMLGYTRDELIGTSILAITAANSVTQTQEAFEKIVKDGQGFTIDKQYRRKDGTILWATSSVNALHSPEGQLQGVVAIVVEITERKQAEEDLKQADRRKDEFLAMLAHELRNPLAPIGAAAELLQMAKLDEERVRKTSQIIDRQVRHMTSLVDDLLDVSRVTRGLVTLDNEPLDIGHVVADAIEQVTPMMRSRHHHLGLQITPDAPLVMGDKKRLVQIVTNLLNNACKYTSEGGNILVKTEVRDSDVLIQVVDNGIGMAPELVSRAFDLFAQAERTSDRTSGGLGLGLALVKSLVELHQGTVTAESLGLGKGSTFTVHLPRLHAGSIVDSLQDVFTAPQSATRPLRIMVVDDNVDAAAMLAMLLEASGHEVLIEHGSRKALERARKETPDVCLLDIGLPEIDGNELAMQLRAQPEASHAVLIAVTGYGQESDRRNALSAGFDHHLVKPVDTTALTSILSTIKAA
jgi:PAS domain S-box-containing protein